MADTHAMLHSWHAFAI